MKPERVAPGHSLSWFLVPPPPLNPSGLAEGPGTFRSIKRKRKQKGAGFLAHPYNSSQLTLPPPVVGVGGDVSVFCGNRKSCPTPRGAGATLPSHRTSSIFSFDFS